MIDLRHGDCLQVMGDIPSGSVDAIICDLPYGTTACKWDTVIPFAPLWEHYKRVIKRNGAIVLFANQPFTTALVASNLSMFRYQWYWYKNNPVGFQLARKQPMRSIEDIAVFYSAQPTYNPQLRKTSITDRKVRNGMKNGREGFSKLYDTVTYAHPLNEDVLPHNVLEFSVVPRATGTLHPTQKPVALMEYLIRTYTNEGETVLDNCMGSGTTGVACVNTDRNFIGIEKDEGYYNVAQQRIQAALSQARQLPLAV